MPDKANDLILDSNKGKGNSSNKPTTRTIYSAKVTEVNDPLDALRIQAYIPALDRNIDTSELWAISLLPKYQCTVPKIGELVWIILMDVSRPYSLRMWVGGAVSQLQFLEEDTWERSLSTTDEAFNTPGTPVSSIPSALGVYPVDDVNIHNVNLLGRGTTDIQQQDNTVLTRAGKYQSGQPTRGNNKNPAYQQLSIFDDSSQSYSVTQADTVFLISNLQQLANSLYPDQGQVKKMQDNYFSVPRAEPLVAWMKLITQYLCLEHTHPIENASPSFQKETKNIPTMDKLLNFDYTSVFNPGVKLN